MNVQHHGFTSSGVPLGTDGPTARVEVTGDLRIGSHIAHPDFTAYVTVYRDPFSERWEIGRMEVETWLHGKRSTRVVMLSLPGQDATIDHFYADAILDATEKPQTSAYIEDELAKIEAEWLA